MDDRIDCERFQDILDATLPGLPRGDSLDILEKHARSCAECAMILRVHLDLARTSEEELAGAVPEGLAGGMWEKVTGAISRPGAGPDRPRDQRRWFGPAVAGLSAAVVLLVLVSVFLLAEISRMRTNERSLHARLSSQEEKLATLIRERSSASGALNASGNRETGWRLAAFFSGGITVAELSDAISGMDPASTLLGPAEFSEAAAPGWTMKRTAGPIVTPGVDLSDGLQAGEALILLRRTGIDPGTRITREKITEFGGKYGLTRPAGRYM
ncbi:MAG TPA: hypothetical protein VLA34_13440 [Candidatus Krumholzibacterium sp.]|nr:hypothetical protein [Candidatus Krumholzibacterium sp.]